MLIGAITLAAGVIPAAVVSQPARASETTILYTCQFPSKVTRQVKVAVSATFPESGQVGKPIRPKDASIRVTIPAAAVGELTKLNDVSVTGVASLWTGVTQNGKSSTAVWNIKIQKKELSSDKNLVLMGSVKVPPVTVGESGQVRFSAGGLLLSLVPLTTADSPTNQNTISINCTPIEGVNSQFGVLPVSAKNKRPISGKSKKPIIGSSDKSDSPNGLGSSNRHKNVDSPYPSCLTSHTESEPKDAYGNLLGFSNVNKLHGAELVGPGGGESAARMNIQLYHALTLYVTASQTGCVDKYGRHHYGGDFHLFSHGDLDYHGKKMMPPTQADFLTFNFMPTTTTTELSSSTMNIDTYNYYTAPLFDPDRKHIQMTTVDQDVTISITDLKVNGVKLNVGPHCKTRNPTHLRVIGVLPEYGVKKGGVLRGYINIPPFSGCGVGEDLDPLVTASVSSPPGNEIPDNFVKLTQGKLCTPAPDSTNHKYCPDPPIPEPKA